MSQGLFATVPRSDFAKNPHARSTYEFLDSTADPAFSRVRDLLETWFAMLPEDSDKKDLRKRLAKGHDGQFHSAWFELYHYVLLRSMGFDLEVHPTLAGVGTHTDFHATRDGRAMLVEATIPDRGPKAHGREQRRAHVTDAIDRIESANFGLQFDIEKEGPNAPSMRDVVRRTRRWLDDLNWSEIRAELVSHKDPYRLPFREDHAGGWRFSFRAWPRAPKARGAGGGAIYLGPSEGGCFAHDETLRSRLEHKAKKYGTDLDEPLVIAVRFDEMGLDDQDVASALYGPSISTWDPKTEKVERTIRRGEGLWHRDGVARNHQVTAVLAYSAELRPWSVSRISPTLWLNPSANHALPDLPWDRAALGADGEIVRTAGTFDPSTAFALPAVAEVDGGPASWPGRAFAE